MYQVLIKDLTYVYEPIALVDALRREKKRRAENNAADWVWDPRVRRHGDLSLTARWKYRIVPIP
eukprot:scaffold125618_cov16-Prasinocladus_malaysianus.AAC.1